MSEIELNDEQRAMLAGEQGLARQMGLRLVLDLASMAGAKRLVPIGGAHLSGVSPLTGGLGLRLFLARLAADGGAGVAAPTTLNSAGCDEHQFESMRIAEPKFLDHHREIIDLYARLGVRTIQSCVPYEWEGVVAAQSGAPVAWAESNAICFANSYCGLRTNRESGLSALACALTGYAPDYGLLDDAARRPNLAVTVTTPLDDPTDYSILGDWIGKQRRPGWRMPYGPIPTIGGLPGELSHEQRKALSAAAANYGCPLLYTADSSADDDYQDRLTFGPAELARRYEELRPRGPVSLVVLGCPQASLGELAAIARLLRGRRVSADPAAPGGPPPLWVFTSAAAKAIAERNGLADAIRDSGALLLENTCPEVVPYDQTWVHSVLTNSMKAEHYIKSGLNGIATAVMRLADCIAIATGEFTLEEVATAEDPLPNPLPKGAGAPPPALREGDRGKAKAEEPITGPSFVGRGLLSQGDFTVEGKALVTDTPITFLGYVNRLTGVIEEDDHPANGQSLAGKVAIFPRGTGSSVAPYVLLELHYHGVGPLAVVNSEIDQQTVPACSLEGIPYAYGFDADVTRSLRSGDRVRLTRRGEVVTLELLEEPRG